MENNTELTAKERVKNRKRTNILHTPEFIVIDYLCPRIPQWMSSDVLTAIGFLGSILTCVGIFMATKNKYFLLLSVFGLAVQWFGDSLDGRIAYYRNTPRKWYGWVLDMNLDWISTVFMGLAMYYYLPTYKFMAFAFVAWTGHSYILALMRYRITDVYLIDADGPVGPTELRILLSLSIFLEIFIPNFLLGFGAVGVTVICIMNTVDFLKILKLGDQKDIEERKAKAESLNS